MELRISAPNRIDLAGGTTDIYPLYLFMDGGFTVNAAVTVKSHVVIRSDGQEGVRIVSEDLGETFECACLEDLAAHGRLSLVCRAVRLLAPDTGLEIITRNEAPAGSGLGASSALLVALLVGLHALRGEDPPGKNVVELAANIEAADIGVPTGLQDHIGAFFGGVSAINFGCRGFEREPLCTDPTVLSELEAMITLSYTGMGRFSGMNNWDVTKGFIDNRPSVREKLTEIRDIARELGRALQLGRLDDVPGLVDLEWRTRRSLAPGISNPSVERIMNAAREAGASASKICGAGGGGCMVTISRPGKKSRVEEAISREGGTVLPASLETTGVTVTTVPPGKL